MAPIEKKLKELIESYLNNGEADLEMLPNGRVAGHVISTEFEDLSYEDRRKRIWGILNQHMTQEEKALVSTLLTYTPAEWNVPLAD